jgi:hypothetical protein
MLFLHEKENIIYIKMSCVDKKSIGSGETYVPPLSKRCCCNGTVCQQEVIKSTQISQQRKALSLN